MQLAISMTQPDACSFSVASRNRYKFTGKERDPESNLDNFGARYMASVDGRFMSPDWSAAPTGVPYADFDNPQSLNLYSYVKNNPTTVGDPDGHCAEDACVIEGTAAIGAAVYVGGAALVAGTAAVLSTPSGQRSLSTFTSAASQSISNSISGIKSFFSKSESKPAPATPAPATGQGQQTAPATAPAGQQVPVQAPGFVGDAGGNVVAIPPGSTARPADNGNGVVYQPPVGAGEHPDANAVRVMGPSANQPTGSITVHGPTGQPINPSTGKPDTRANTHTPIKPTPNN
jgi:RHS repeat-associated protein